MYSNVLEGKDAMGPARGSGLAWRAGMEDLGCHCAVHLKQSAEPKVSHLQNSRVTGPGVHHIVHHIGPVSRALCHAHVHVPRDSTRALGL